MKLNLGQRGIGLECASLNFFESIQTDLDDIEILNTGLESLNLAIENGMELPSGIGTEGLITDTARTLTKAVTNSAKLGTKTYKTLDSKYTSLKNRYVQYYKPLLIKILKELGNRMKMIYIKFMKLGKRYAELGKEINFILTNSIKQVGSLPDGYSIVLYDFEAYVMRGYVDIMGDYKTFFGEVVTAFAPNYKSPKDLVNLIKSKRINEVAKVSKSMSDAMASINKYGDISIPWKVYKSERYFKLFKSITQRNPTPDQIKGSLSDFVKKSILGKEMTLDLKVTDRNLFIKAASEYLTVVGSILNNNVLQTALDNGAKSLKGTTQELLATLNEVTEAADSVGMGKTSVQATPDANAEQDKDTPKPKYTGMSANQSDIDAIDAYVQNFGNIVNKTSVVYSGITIGTLSALYDVVSCAEKLVILIKNSVGKGVNNNG